MDIETGYAIKLAQGVHENIFTERRNWLCIVIGRVGSGKSLASMSLAKMFDPTFNLDRVLFDENAFMEAVQSDLPPGSFLIGDEIGSWMPAREYMTTVNRLLSYVLQTWRFKRFGIFWTVPQRRQVDINIRSMADMLMEMMTIHRDIQATEVKLKFVQTNPTTGFERTPFPKVTRIGEGDITINRCMIPRPARSFEKAYERKKMDVMAKFYERIHNELDGTINGDGKRNKRAERSSIRNQIAEALKSGKDVLDVARELNTTYAYVKQVQKVI